MNIVIIGAGNIGSYLAEILSKERFNVILIDNDETRLDSVAQSIDVGVRVGDGTEWRLLDDLLEVAPDLLIALTGNDEVNLVACAIAKNLGYGKTIARVKNPNYLNRTRLDFGRVFMVDHFVGPDVLVANDIYKYMSSPGSLAVESFAHGAVQLRTITVPKRWKQGDVRLCDLDLPEGMMIGLIRRNVVSATGKPLHPEEKSVIFPHGNDCILPDDEVTVIGETDVITDVHFLFGSIETMVKSVVIVGGSRTAVSLAALLEKRDVNVRIIEKDYERCRQLAEDLPESTIIHDDGTNLDLLLSEKVDKADIFVSCTSTDELNLMISLVAKEAGCKNVVMILSGKQYMPLVDKLGISHAISPRVSAINKIIPLIRAQAVSSMFSIYEHQAEIVELRVSKDSKAVGIPIAELGPQMPRDFLIAVIQNRGRIMIANGNRILSPGDTVIVVTHPKHIHQLEKVF